MISFKQQMDTVSEFELDGGGDRRASSLPESDTPRYVKRKLTSGLPIPVFTNPDADHQDFGPDEGHAEALWFGATKNHTASEGPVVSQTKLQTPVQSSVSVLKEFLCCPICNDPCIETTTTNCGHKFCRQCIDDWRAQKPICPVCSTLITSLHRLYSDDLFVESQLAFLRPDVKLRFKDAQMKRLQKLMEERQSRNVIKTFRRKLDSSLVYLRCKNSAGIGNKILSTTRILTYKLAKLSEHFNLTLLVGIMIGALMLLATRYLSDNTQFLNYMWLAAKNYNGTIPEQWLPLPPPSSLVPQTPSLFEEAVDTLNRLAMWK